MRLLSLAAVETRAPSNSPREATKAGAGAFRALLTVAKSRITNHESQSPANSRADSRRQGFCGGPPSGRRTYACAVSRIRSLTPAEQSQSVNNLLPVSPTMGFGTHARARNVMLHHTAMLYRYAANESRASRALKPLFFSPAHRHSHSCAPTTASSTLGRPSEQGASRERDLLGTLCAPHGQCTRLELKSFVHRRMLQGRNYGTRTLPSM